MISASLNAKLFAGFSVTAVVAVVVAGLFLIGSPEQERMRRADDARIGDLMQISNALDTYWYKKGVLPAALGDLSQEQDVYVFRITDPTTDAPYEYRATGDRTYELCATFEASGDQDSLTDRPKMDLEGFWAHGTGRVCFPLEIRMDPFRTLPIPAPIR